MSDSSLSSQKNLLNPGNVGHSMLPHTSLREKCCLSNHLFLAQKWIFFINTKSIYSYLSCHENLLFELLSFLNNSFEFLQYFPIGKVCSNYTSLCDWSAKHDHLSLVLLWGNSSSFLEGQQLYKIHCSIAGYSSFTFSATICFSKARISNSKIS